jgi:SP family myo-inositol transporter-like MFS transporter 13
VYPEAEPHEIDLKIHVMLANVRQVQAFQSKTPFIKLPVLLFSKGPYRRATIAAAGLMFFQQFAGFNTLLYYAPTLFGFAGFDNPTATGIIVAATNLVFTAVGMFTMDRVGKRRLLLLMIPFQVLGLALVAVAFAKMTEPSGGVLAAEFASLYEAKCVLSSTL